MPRKLKLKVLRGFEIIERPCAWILLLGGMVTFVGVVAGVIATGDVKAVTLLVAAGLIVDGFSAVQQSQDEEEIDDLEDDDRKP